MTGKYRFYLAGNDLGYLYMDTQNSLTKPASIANLTRIATSSHSYFEEFNRQTNQISSEIELTKDSAYWMEGYLYGKSSDDYLNVGVEIPSIESPINR